MTYTVEPIETGKRWKIITDERTCGEVQRLSTGYLVTLEPSGQKIKRFRMIDALREALGDEHEISIVGGNP